MRAPHTTEDGRAMTTPGTDTASTNDIASGGDAGGLLLVSR
ncbi:hypothetical protein ACIGW8_25345 [Streptomyces sioyaensis]